MAHTLLGEQRQGRSTLRSSGGVPVLDETYHYLVRADSTTADRLSILQTVGVPVPRVTVSPGGYGLCKTTQAVRREDQILLWDITSEFSSEVEESQTGAGGGGGSDPTTWVPVYETKFERLQEIATEDVDGDAIANSAGQPFETGIIRARFIPIWEFFQFEAASVTDEDVIGRNEVINDSTFKGRAANTLLCTVLSSVIGFYYGASRRLTRYSLRYNDIAWTHKRLDVGTVYLDTGVQKPYLDNSGNVMLGGLDGSGAKVTPGDPPAILEFHMYDEVDFDSFLRV